MSYCRFSEADVYVFMSVGGFLECCGCWMSEHSFQAHTTAEMVAHLQAHIDAKDYVPERVIPQLLADDAENFPAARGGT